MFSKPKISTNASAARAVDSFTIYHLLQLCRPGGLLPISTSVTAKSFEKEEKTEVGRKGEEKEDEKREKEGEKAQLAGSCFLALKEDEYAPLILASTLYSDTVCTHNNRLPTLCGTINFSIASHF